MTTERQPTLDTVAAAAGVSRATVSRVINGSPRVSPEARDLVEDTIARLGYVPNRAARSLASRRTDSVALVLREADATVLADPYLSAVIIATSQALVGTGVQLVLVNAQNDAEHQRVGEYVRSGHVDGVLLASMHADDPLPQLLVQARVPVVVGGRPERPIPGLVYVDTDNVGGAQLATERLVAAGRSRIAHIAGPPDMTAAADRLTGYHRALARAGRDAGPVAFGDFTRASGEAAMATLLDHNPDAVFAANDMMAIGALRTLRAAGRRVPEDVALVGYDDIELAQHTEPALTTIRQPVVDQARTMTELLLLQIGGQPPGDPVVLPTELVPRESA
ncbi:MULTISPECIES: LacI family DNA-binding transcriptional regulator [Actinokineospora]|uniref:LacI family transcriptional regulator n=1 Tax=Actinokineospora fastidiosa TaxID=1816 RepID=A0A918GS33_9PSEU|nr:MULTISPECIES: LacI family DNA-binding transcriptional regulator [Actinokineospora]UVS81552.1 Ribose operon repressor [Actinokineospora sp. UTMC 2448]GGS57255.1 LacI family transcriptional regulator [Actinokineospora fastidiosa]